LAVATLAMLFSSTVGNAAVTDPSVTAKSRIQLGRFGPLAVWGAHFTTNNFQRSMSTPRAGQGLYRPTLLSSFRKLETKSTSILRMVGLASFKRALVWPLL
jgi:hypothetical protein